MDVITTLGISEIQSEKKISLFLSEDFLVAVFIGVLLI